MTSETNSLDPNWRDAIAAVIRGGVGAIPILGNAVTELLLASIQNQRIDRIAGFVSDLGKKLEHLDINLLERLCQNESCLEFLENGMIEGSKALTQERKNYIIEIIMNGITEDELTYQESLTFLRLLSQLSDIEIIWLRYTLNPSTNGDEEFRQTHKKLLARPKLGETSNNEDEIKLQSDLQELYKARLQNLNLIYPKYRMKSTGNKYSGGERKFLQDGSDDIKYYKVTHLGRRLLKQIGVIDDINFTPHYSMLEIS